MSATHQRLRSVTDQSAAIAQNQSLLCWGTHTDEWKLASKRQLLSWNYFMEPDKVFLQLSWLVYRTCWYNGGTYMHTEAP